MAGAAVWALAGGKGGAGRTMLAANLAIQVARSDRRVVAIDCDMQCAHLHAALGFNRIRRGLPALAAGGTRLVETAVETSIPNLRLVGGLQGARPPDDPSAVLALVRQGLADLEADVVVLDCGSGRSRAVLDAFAMADLGLVTATPEPPALEGAVLFVESHLRACFHRALPEDTRKALGELLATEGLALESLPFRDLMLRLGGLDARARGLVASEAGRTRLELLLNMVRDEHDEEGGAALAGALRKALGVPLPIAGLIEHDPSVVLAVAKGRPLSQQFPNTPATRGIGRAAARLLAASGSTGRSDLPEWEDLDQVDHYRVLEITPKASSKEIQSAYHVLRRAFEQESTPLAPLVPAETLRAIMTRVEDAYRTLIFLESRVAYDRQLVDSGRLAADQIRGLHGGLAASHGAGHPPAAEPGAARETHAPSTRPDDPPAAPTAGAETAAAAAPEATGGATTAPAEPGPTAPPLPLSGAALRAERLRLGQSLESIAARTKIRVAYLQAIEEEQFERLPPPVFLRGFVRELAACLGLPPDETARAILDRRAARTDPSDAGDSPATRRSA
jgi:flagellar biosynthesis protein FlhG